MAIKLKVNEDKVVLKVGDGDSATLNAVREARPILVNDYDNLINKPSINGTELVGDVTLTASDVGALPDTTPIPDDNNLVHKTGTETITGSKSFTNGVEISRSNSGAILKLSSAASDTNFILERTGGSQCVLESGSALGLFGTKTNHPLQVRTNYVNRMTVGTDGSVVLASDVAANSDSNQVATTKWVNAKGYAKASAVPTKVSQLTNDSGFVDSAGAASAAPVQSVNGQTGSVSLSIPTKVSDLTNDSNFSSVSVSQTLSSGTEVGKITIDGTPTTLYAPTDTDTKVTQTVTATTDYTYWRGLCIGASSSQAESGSLSNITDQVRIFSNLRVQPSTGTIKATTFKGNLTGNVTGNVTGDVTGTASGNLTASSTLDPTKISGVASGGTDFLRQDGAWASAPVTSVNGSTGAVSLTATDVSALPDSTTYAASPTVGGSATFANGIHYAAVDSTSTSTAFTAQIPAITSYYDGLTVILYNGVVTSAANFTININGLGAYGSYSNMAVGNSNTPTAPTRDTTIFNINYAMIFIYCSNIGGQGITGWIGYRGYDANTNTIGYQVRTNSYSLPMTSIVYRYRLLFTSADNEHWVPATNSTSTNATTARTVCQDAINPFGSIVYYGTTASVAAGNRPSVSALWQQYNFNLGYSFQKSPNYSLTSWKPVYLKCAPQADNSAIIDSTEPFTQALPATADGKIYIQLGVAYNTTNIELTLNHPVYYIDANGHKRIWTGEDISSLV